MRAALGSAPPPAVAIPPNRRVHAARAAAPGLLLAGAIGLTAHLVAAATLPFGLAVGVEVPLAMLLGLVVVNLGGAGAWAVPGIRVAVKVVLGAGIVLLGLRLNLQSIALIGSDALVLVVLAIAGACTFAVLVGRRLGVETRVAVLVGIGASVCGNSAILAAAPVVKAGDREVSFAIATITLFGTLAVVVLPVLGHLLGLDVLTFGLWAGAAIPDTAQTIATGAAHSTVGRDVAAVVKLVRTVMLAPLLLLLAWVWLRHGPDARVSPDAARRNMRRAFPWFLVGFLALATLRSARLVDPETVADVDVLTRACFVVALAGLGLQTRTAHLRSLGVRPFALGLATATFMAAGTLALITALGLAPGRTAVAGAVDPRAACATRCSGGERVQLSARVLATGIPRAGALSPVGTFHAGGPVHDKRAFAALTRQGEVLDPDRLLVASSSNFGAPLAREDWAPGSVLSLDTGAREPIAVPPRFAAAGDQARALDGAVRLYTAQTPAFVNALPNREAVTADMPAVSSPRGISVNNAFGRPWFANAPAPGVGMESVLDPDGRPLEDAPSERAGGVFAGGVTDREPRPLEGRLDSPAVGNAFLGASPDASGRAVFAVATADGALAQVHVEEGVDPLAPAGTFAGGVGRVGMAFNWVPDRFLYVTDPRRDAVLQLRLGDDFRVFEVEGERRLRSPHFDEPVDLAPAVPEIANPAFSSNTTLAGGADLYIANRGSGKIVRLRQDGRVRAVATVALPGARRVGRGRLNGIAVSSDARKIWLSLTGGQVVEVPAFGAPR